MRMRIMRRIVTIPSESAQNGNADACFSYRFHFVRFTAIYQIGPILGFPTMRCFPVCARSDLGINALWRVRLHSTRPSSPGEAIPFQTPARPALATGTIVGVLFWGLRERDGLGAGASFLQFYARLGVGARISFCYEPSFRGEKAGG